MRFDMPDRTVSNFVRAVLPARDGSLWFGREEGGLVRLREGVATVFDRSEGLPASRVNHLLEAADGGIWAATHGGGVARFTGAGFVPVDEGLPDLRVWQLLEGTGRRGRIAGSWPRAKGVSPSWATGTGGRASTSERPSRESA